jgi:hypothetical protein
LNQYKTLIINRQYGKGILLRTLGMGRCGEGDVAHDIKLGIWILMGDEGILVGRWMFMKRKDWGQAMEKLMDSGEHWLTWCCPDRFSP